VIEIGKMHVHNLAIPNYIIPINKRKGKKKRGEGNIFFV
jgi:hypothetical protein